MARGKCHRFPILKHFYYVLFWLLVAPKVRKSPNQVDKPTEMLFVQRDDMVENLAAAASHPAFRSPVLPRCLNTRALRPKARCLQKGNHIGIESRVVVEDGETIRTSLGKRFPQLLHHPIGGRMTSDVEMQKPAPTMLDDEEAVQELER